MILSACDDYPRDPKQTLEQVLATGSLCAVAVTHEPWVAAEAARPPSGVEVRLVEAYARDLGVTVEWHRAPAQEVMEALHFGEADLAVCGFTAEFVEADGQAASTYAYIIEKIVVAVEPGTPAPRDIDAQKVVVGDDRRIAALVTAKGGIPVPNGGGLVALPLWQVGDQGLERTPISLRRDRHVMAVPSGENAWLVRLERFLRTEAGSVAGLLAQEAL